MKENQPSTFEKFIVTIGELAPDGKSVLPRTMTWNGKDSKELEVSNRMETLEPLWTISMGMSEYSAPWLNQAGVTEVTVGRLVELQAMLATLSPIAPPQARDRLNWMINWIQFSVMNFSRPAIVIETK